MPVPGRHLRETSRCIKLEEEPQFGLKIAQKVTETDKMLNLGLFLSPYRPHMDLMKAKNS